jgi:hypothetical protein
MTYDYVLSPLGADFMIILGKGSFIRRLFLAPYSYSMWCRGAKTPVDTFHVHVEHPSSFRFGPITKARRREVTDPIK